MADYVLAQDSSLQWSVLDGQFGRFWKVDLVFYEYIFNTLLFMIDIMSNDFFLILHLFAYFNYCKLLQLFLGAKCFLYN